MKAVFYILLGAGFTVTAATAMGLLLLQWLRVELKRAEHAFFSFVCGSACLSTLVFLLTAAGLARKATFYTAGGVMITLAIWRKAYRLAADDLPPMPRLWAAAFWIIYGAFGWIYLGNALAPETSPDGIAYHVSVIARYLREHHFPGNSTDWRANFGQGIEMLFMIAFSIGKHSAAALVEFAFLLITPLGMLAYARRIGRPGAGVVAAILFYASPVVGRDGTVAYVDVASACIAFALYYLLQVWREERNPRLLILIGLAAGFGFAAKYTAIFGLMYAMAYVAFSLWRWRRPFVKPLAILSACALLMMAPWLIKNAIVAGNPVSPFLNRIFPNPHSYESTEQDLIESQRHLNGARLEDVPLEVTIRGGRLIGLIGPVFLLAPIGLAALRFPAGRQVLLAAAIYLLPYLANIGARFLIVPLPFIALAMALAVPMIGPAILVAHAILSWPSIVNRYCDQYAWRIEGSNRQAALRRVPEVESIRGAVEDYDFGLLMDKLVPDGQPVLSWSVANPAYHSREIVTTIHSALGSRLEEALTRAVEENNLSRVTFEFPRRQLRLVKIIQTSTKHDLWTVGEVRLWDGANELARAPGWRLRASANRWEIPLAFDNSPASWWNARQYAGAGQFIEIELDREALLDRITVDMPGSVNGISMRLEGIDAKTSTASGPVPAGMRRAAVEEAKLSGIHWIAVRDGDHLWQDLLERSPQWGITQVARNNRFRLWHLD